MIAFMANILLNSLICGIVFIVIYVISPLFNDYSRKWRHIVFMVLAIKMIIPLEVMSFPGAISVEIGRQKNVEVTEHAESVEENDAETTRDSSVANMSTEATRGSSAVNMSTEAIEVTDDAVDNTDIVAGDISLNDISDMLQTKESNDAANVKKRALSFTASSVLLKQNILANIKMIFITTFSLWFIVAAIKLIIYWLMYQYHRYSIKRWSTPVRDKNVIEMFEEEKRFVGTKSDIELRRCRRINTPMTVGFVHTKVLIPVVSEDYEELRYILRHELIHIKRKDMYTKLLYVIMKCMHWFNPLAYKLAKVAYDDMELLCDDEVVKSMGRKERIKYNEALLDVARKQVLYDKAATIAFSFGLVEGENSLKERLLNIMNMTSRKKGYSIAFAMCVILILVGGFAKCEDVIVDEVMEAAYDMDSIIAELEMIQNIDEVEFLSDKLTHKEIEEGYLTAEAEKSSKEAQQKVLSDELLWKYFVYAYAYAERAEIEPMGGYEKRITWPAITYIVTALDDTEYDNDEIEVVEIDGVKYNRVKEKLIKGIYNVLSWTPQKSRMGEWGFYKSAEKAYYLLYRELPESDVSFTHEQGYIKSRYTLYNVYCPIYIKDNNEKAKMRGTYEVSIYADEDNRFGFGMAVNGFKKQKNNKK